MMSAISTSIYVIKSYTATFYIPANCIYFSLIMNSLIWLKSGTDRFIFILYVSSSMYREKIIFLQLWKKQLQANWQLLSKKSWIIFFQKYSYSILHKSPWQNFYIEKMLCVFFPLLFFYKRFFDVPAFILSFRQVFYYAFMFTFRTLDHIRTYICSAIALSMDK